MSDYDNTNTGVLFKNARKDSDKHPDYKGQINADGVEYWVSGWKKTSKKGEPFLSLKLTPKDFERQVEKKEKPAAAPEEPDVQF